MGWLRHKTHVHEDRTCLLKASGHGRRKAWCVVGDYQIGAHSAEQAMYAFLLHECREAGKSIAVVVSLLRRPHRVTCHSNEEDVFEKKSMTDPYAGLA